MDLNAYERKRGLSPQAERRVNMKRELRLLEIGLIIFCVVMTQGCVVRETTPPHPGPDFHHGFLRVTELVMTPDPVREGQRIRFAMVMVNNSSHSRRVSIAVRDGDELVNEVSDIAIHPGANRISFPWTGYRFSRQDPCFIVLVNIEGTYKPVDLARKFCVHRTNYGWTMGN
jgi:hypothetical protein